MKTTNISLIIVKSGMKVDQFELLGESPGKQSFILGVKEPDAGNSVNITHPNCQKWYLFQQDS